MAKNEGKSKAEIYREERKERIAKANKKNAKSIEKGKTVGKIAKKAVAIVLVCAIVLGLGYTVAKNTGIVRRLAPALKFADGTSLSASEFNYYYYNAYSYMVNLSQYMAQYGASADQYYDSTKAPDKQTTKDEDGNEITYKEYFRTQAIELAQAIKAFNEEAKAAGYEIDDDIKAEIDETIENYRSSASENGFSLNAYLQSSFGAGITEKKLRKLIEAQEIYEHYREYKQEKLGTDISEEELEKEYKDNKKLYDYTDLRYYVFRGEVLEAKDGESDDALKARQEKANKALFADANAVFDKVTDQASLEKAIGEYLDSKEKEDTKAEDKAEDAAEETAEEAKDEKEEEKEYTTESTHSKYDTINGTLNDAAADWAFDSARKAGDVNIFTDETDAYIVFIEKPAYNGHSVDVRHLLVSFNAEDSNNPTDEEKAEAKKKAEEYLAEWKNGEATEESFAELAKEHSDDTGSTESGGLYAAIRVTDSYVEPFLNWSFDSSRKVGDCEIVETTYGYHIMYFAKDNVDDVDWKATIRSDKADDLYSAYEEEVLAEDGKYAATPSKFWTNRIANDFCNKITRNLALQSR